jgi:hypothetical protein
MKWFVVIAILGLIAIGGWLSFNSRIETMMQDGDEEISELALDDLDTGCLGGKDCIPSIDKPVFESAFEADRWLENDDRVFGVDYLGVQKAYSQRILNWHEIVNDQFGDESVAITFCPLCGSALGFKRLVRDQVSEFGVSGKLHNSDLVMYDRLTDSYWQQITGEAIIGSAKGQVLEQIPIITTTWAEWKNAKPETLNLSRDTGVKRDYDQYPYGTYEENDEILFGVENIDKSLQIKTVVYGVELEGRAKAYVEEDLTKLKIIEDKIGETNIKIERSESGEVKVTNEVTGVAITPIRLFWFAWAAFHPDTEIYQIP